MVCAGIQKKLALVCAWDKKIFHQIVKTFDFNFVMQTIIFILLDTCFALVNIEN